MKKISKIMILYLLMANMNAFGALPISPDKVFKPEEISDIHNTQDYFYAHKMDDSAPVWIHTHRKYGDHLLGTRTSPTDLKMAVHHILNDGLPIRRRLEDLFRARLGIHSRIGDALPSLKNSFAGNVNGVVTEAFSGLLGFLSPANWLAIANQDYIHKATKLLLIKDVMDEVLKAKLAYLDQHQRITDFEILNYYFAHLQVLAQKFKVEDRALETLRAEYAVEVTDMASQRGEIKLGFDSFALATAPENIGGRYCVDLLNIDELTNFPLMYKDKEEFLKTVVQKSVELKVVHQLLKVSKLNIGVTAFGGLVDDRSSVTSKTGATMALKVGYGTLPNILISKSFARTAQIDVRTNYLNMLDNARRSFDFYVNSLGGFAEAKRSIKLSRDAFKKNLAYILENNVTADALFIISINQLIRTELKLNNALHGSLKARAWMDRFLLVDDLGALSYLPKKSETLDVFDNVMRQYQDETTKEQTLDKLMTKVRTPKKLSAILYGNGKKQKLNPFTASEINDALMRNMGHLMHQKLIKRKNKEFFSTLHDYISKQNLPMPSALTEKIGYPDKLALPEI